MPSNNHINILFEQSSSCKLCSKNFYAFRRKHRCKSCGIAVCSSCARTHKVLTHSIYVSSLNLPVRVCDRCVILLQRPFQNEENNLRNRMIPTYNNNNNNRSNNQEIVNQRVFSHTSPISSPMEIMEMEDATQHRRSSLRENDEINNVLNRSYSYDKLNASRTDSIASKAANYISRLNNASRRSSLLNKNNFKICQSINNNECSICLDSMQIGKNAIIKTACLHTFHWICLKECMMKENNNKKNKYNCPVCRSGLDDIIVQKNCFHPRVRSLHKYCRDCGKEVTKKDIKQSNLSNLNTSILPQNNNNNNNNTTTMSTNHWQYGLNELNQIPINSPTGAVVRCPHCRILMRVLPHMYNMRVACPSGHPFQVSILSNESNNNGSPQIMRQEYNNITTA